MDVNASELRPVVVFFYYWVLLSDTLLIVLEHKLPTEVNI